MAFNGRITLGGDKEAAALLVPRAKQEFERLLAKHPHVSGMAQQRRQLNETGAWCEVRVFEGGLETLYIYAPPASSNPIPDFYSGVVSPAMAYTLNKGQLGEFGKQITEDDVPAVRSFFAETRKASPFIAAGELQPLGDTITQRFAITDNRKTGFVDTGAGEKNGKKFPQVRHIYASMYSGDMAAVVQFLLGLGKPIWRTCDDADKPDKKREVIDTAVREAKPSDILARFLENENSAEIAYLWGSGKTHGIIRAGGWPVLVEVSGGGVRATLLPVDAQTDIRQALFTDKIPFKDIAHPVLAYLRARSSDENAPGDKPYYDAVLLVIKKFGGFPTGELPKETRTVIERGREVSLDNWIELLDAKGMEKWGDTSPYSSAMGWAFSPTVNEARNTGWQIRGIRAMAGYDFKLSFSVSLDDEQASGLSGFASLLWRSGYLPSLANVKFPEPAVNGLISAPERPNGPMVTDNESRPAPFYLHVFYNNAGTLVALEFDVSAPEPMNDVSYSEGQCATFEYRSANEVEWIKKSAFGCAHLPQRFSSGNSKHTAERRVLSAPQAQSIINTAGADGSSGLESYGQVYEVKWASWHEHREYEKGVSAREGWAIPLYDRCALYKIDFKYCEEKQVDDVYGIVSKVVDPICSTYFLDTYSTVPIYGPVYGPDNNSPGGCAYSAFLNVSTWDYGPRKNIGFAPPASNAPNDGCTEFFGRGSPPCGQCNNTIPASYTVSTPSVPPNVTVNSLGKWQRVLSFINREGRIELSNSTGDKPAGGSEQAWKNNVYGTWFSRSPDLDGMYDYISATVSCLGGGGNYTYRTDLSERGEPVVVTTFGFASDDVVPPNFVGVL